QLLESDQALKEGLVDEVVPLDQVMTVAKKEVAKWLEVPDIGRARVKAGIRENDLEVFRKDRDKDATLFARLNSSPEVQAILETTLKNLKKQKK
ncbi:putative enoyl-CoA delta isomerase 1, mitochondrial, partial [Apostichopus japonicus]